MNIKLIKNHNNKTNDINNLEKNDLIKLDDGEEIFWAIIQKKLRKCVLAKIDSKLLFEKKYNYGDLIKCEFNDIIDYIKI